MPRCVYVTLLEGSHRQTSIIERSAGCAIAEPTSNALAKHISFLCQMLSLCILQAGFSRDSRARCALTVV